MGNQMFTDEQWERIQGKTMNDSHQSDSVAIVSGGMDSITLVYHMIHEGFVPHLLSFNYGQRHKKELQYAGITARHLGLKHDIVDLTGITHLISNSALTSARREQRQYVTGQVDGQEEIDVPEGHYAEESMKATVVPNRNMIMLSIAAGVAVNNKYRAIGIGVHGGDHFIYPDCRPQFVEDMNVAILAGNEGFHAFPEADATDGLYGSPIYAPFILGSKADIAYRGIKLSVPFHLTWSCYKGGEKHCGKCGTCVERLEAIHEAQMRRLNEMREATDGSVFAISNVDQTVYEDDEFWKTAVKNG